MKIRTFKSITNQVHFIYDTRYTAHHPQNAVKQNTFQMQMQIIHKYRLLNLLSS